MGYLEKFCNLQDCIKYGILSVCENYCLVVDMFELQEMKMCYLGEGAAVYIKG